MKSVERSISSSHQRAARKTHFGIAALQLGLAKQILESVDVLELEIERKKENI
jgi:hypothetical protein